MTPTYDENGELDFYHLWSAAQKRIHELEQRIDAIQRRAMEEIERAKTDANL